MYGASTVASAEPVLVGKGIGVVEILGELFLKTPADKIRQTSTSVPNRDTFVSSRRCLECR